MKIERAHPGQTINLGRMGEHNVRQVVFDLSEWMEQYGPGRAEILYQRSGDERPYLRPATQAQDTLVWTIDSWDTEYSKSGKCELRWYNAETDSLAKSKSWSTTVGASLGVPSTEAPHEPELGWVEEVLSAGAQAQYASQVARISEHNAEVWVEGGILLDEYGKPVAEEVAGVKGYAAAAKASKDAAAYSAKEAALYQNVVYQNAQRAESAANRSESAAAIAEPAAERAEAARNSIVLDEEKMDEARYVAEYSAKVAKDGQTKGFTASATLSGGASKTSIGTLELGRQYTLYAKSTNGSVAQGKRFVYTGKPFSFSASTSDGMESYEFEAEVSCSGNTVTLTNKGGRAVIEVGPEDATQFEAPKTSAERAQSSASAASSYERQASSSASSAQESASSAFNDSVNAQNNADRAEEAYRSAQRSAERAETAVSDAAQYSHRAEAAAERAEAAGGGAVDAETVRQISEEIGDVTTLETDNKANLVGAINEVRATSVSDTEVSSLMSIIQ